MAEQDKGALARMRIWMDICAESDVQVTQQQTFIPLKIFLLCRDFVS